MNRSTTNNGRATDAGHALGGYSAFFASEANDSTPPESSVPDVPSAPPPEPRSTGGSDRMTVSAPPSSVAQPPQFVAPPDPRPQAAAPTIQWNPPAPAAAPTATALPPETAAAQYTPPEPSAPPPPDVADPPSYGQAAEGPSLSMVPDRIEVTPPSAELISVDFVSSAVLSNIVVSNRATLRSTRGMRGALNKVGFRLGLSPSEQRAEARRERIRRQIPGTYQIAVISVKGGVGRTTTTAALGSVFAELRADRVVAIDANPDFGDLATRTVRHPYGLNMRDLVHAPGLDAFSAVQAYTTTNAADLDIVASAWTSNADTALTGSEYGAGVEILRRHYNLLLADCGTGVLDSVTVGVLTTSHAIIVVTPPTVGGVTGAAATLNWLHVHGLQHLVAKSVVAIVHHQPAKPRIDPGAIEKVFASADRATHVLPYDPHLAEGGEVDLRLIAPETRLAFEELAAELADGFPTYREAGR